MREVVIVSGTRTAVGAFGGALKNIPAVQLGSVVIKEALQRAGLRPVAGLETRDLTPAAIWLPEQIEIERRQSVHAFGNTAQTGKRRSRPKRRSI